ncbi:MAG: RsfS/YbeB/iojap family protein, partial [Clostridia bacterium]|nr:RsfS/YbeB/iojap family protein [Clostridia bacterium]
MATGQEIWQRAVHVLDKHKAVDLRVLQVGHVTAITDYFLLATGGSATQLRSLSDYLERELGMDGVRPLRQDGYQTGD